MCRVAGDMAEEGRHGSTLANWAVCRQTGGKRAGVAAVIARAVARGTRHLPETNMAEERVKRRLAAILAADAHQNVCIPASNRYAGWSSAYREYQISAEMP